MGRDVGYAIAFEREIEGLDPRTFDGRKLALERHSVDAIAHEYDLPGLGEFVAFSHDEAEALAADMKFDAPTVGSETGRWFQPQNGLEVVQQILAHLEENPDDVRDAEAIRSGLTSLESMLSLAVASAIRFRLSVTY